MANVHVVKSGEHLSSIAAKHGFADFRTIWDDPANAKLRALRKNAHVLLPGDELTIPERAAREESGATETRHRFQTSAPSLTLRIVLQDPHRNPLDGVECTVDVEGKTQVLKSDGAGRVEVRIPRTASQGSFRARDASGQLDIDAAMGIGELDPSDAATGQIARLNHLGYDAGPVEEPADDASQLRLRSALEEFQCDHGLAIDGVCGPATRARLEKEHGC